MIYGQAGIDIRYNPSQVIYNTALQVIDSDAEVNALSAYDVGGNTISMFFLDGINFCGAAIPGIVGCALTPGTIVTLDADFVATDNSGAVATGHEIGHNLGLGHLVAPNGMNLMNPSTFTFNPAALPALTQAQIATILASPLVQTELGTLQKFIRITPFAVEADNQVVPEPSTLCLAGLALGVVAWKKRRARTV